MVQHVMLLCTVHILVSSCITLLLMDIAPAKLVYVTCSSPGDILSFSSSVIVVLFSYSLLIMLHGGSIGILRVLGEMAAQIPLMPPEGFDFAHPNSWTKWKKRFEHYRSASGFGKGRGRSSECAHLCHW